MGDNYIDQFGNKKGSAGSRRPELCFVPLAMGMLSFMDFAVYTWSAFHDRSLVMCIVYFVPFISITGMVFSFATRRVRDKHFKVWLSGTIACGLSLVLYIVLFFATWAALAQR